MQLLEGAASLGPEDFSTRMDVVRARGVATLSLRIICIFLQTNMADSNMLTSLAMAISVSVSISTSALRVYEM
jgi:hypothetical protein